MINAVYFYSFPEIMQVQGKIAKYEELFENERIAKDSLFLKLYEKLVPLFQSLELEDKDIILAVSGGADSMMVASQVLYFYRKNELNLNKIHIAHCNHKIRKESEGEAKFMSEFFSDLDFHLFERKDLGNDDENSLRNRRYSQFSSLQESTKSAFVFLGHHLKDRVESTFLNLMRGAGINGFLNMREVEEHHLLPDECKICRPLLSISKAEILNICDEISLPYFEDSTNKDVEISKRNWIRNEIINPLTTYGAEDGEENKFLQSLANIYNQLENADNEGNNELVPMPHHPLWNAEFSYLWNKNIVICNENDVFDLFHMLKVQTSEIIVNERKERLNKGENGYKYIGGVYFFVHEKQLFVVKADEDFWIRKNKAEENIVVNVESMDDIRFLGFNLKIPRDELIGGEVRLPQEGDSFNGKSRHRWALNQKIPMWRRDWIPLAIKNRKVIHMWKNIWKF